MTKTITVSGLEVSYISQSAKTESKTTLVLLHGWGGTKESWNINIETLSKQFDCIAFDLPGFGQSQKPNKPWGTFEYADFLQKFVKALKLHKPVIVGKSFGGRVAIVYASQWPEEISKLVLVSAAGIEEKTIGLKLRIGVINILGKISNLIPGINNESLRKVVYRFLGLKEEGSYKREVKKIVTNQDLETLLPSINAETLIVWGNEDKVLPLRLGKRLADGIKNSRLEVIKDGDHWVHQKHAQAFNQLIIKFL